MFRLFLSYLRDRLFYPARVCVMSANRRRGNFRDAIWLFGDGRSGTTWVSELINWDRSYREMFEPFHPKKIRRMRGMRLHQYIRPGDSDHPFLRRASDVFSGRFSSPRVDHANWSLSYRGLLIKDIFANLLAGWAAQQFPAVKMVLLIRNPFAVALSKSKRRRWSWLTDPSELLAQPELVDKTDARFWVARAVREVPEVNGFYVDGAFRPSEAVHLGVGLEHGHDAIQIALDEGGLGVAQHARQHARRRELGGDGEVHVERIVLARRKLHHRRDDDRHVVLLEERRHGRRVLAGDLGQMPRQ